MNRKLLFLVLGTLFGFLLSRAGATNFDYHAQLFLFEDLQLMWVISTAILVGAIALILLRRFSPRSLLDGLSLDFKGKPMKAGLFKGAALLGVGWGLTGSCPGTAPAMLGEGKLSVAFTIAGMLLGTYLFGVLKSRKQRALTPTCTEQALSEG